MPSSPNVPCSTGKTTSTPDVVPGSFDRVTTAHWITILIIALTTGSGAIFLYYWGLQRVRAMTATICELCLPLSAVFFDYLINGSRLGPIQIAGAALMLISITRVSTRKA